MRVNKKRGYQEGGNEEITKRGSDSEEEKERE